MASLGTQGNNICQVNPDRTFHFLWLHRQSGYSVLKPATVSNTRWWRCTAPLEVTLGYLIWIAVFCFFFTDILRPPLLIWQSCGDVVGGVRTVRFGLCSSAFLRQQTLRWNLNKNFFFFYRFLAEFHKCSQSLQHALAFLLFALTCLTPGLTPTCPFMSDTRVRVYKRKQFFSVPISVDANAAETRPGQTVPVPTVL